MDGCGKFRPHRDSIPGPSLYRLTYPGPTEKLRSAIPSSKSCLQFEHRRRGLKIRKAGARNGTDGCRVNSTLIKLISLFTSQTQNCPLEGEGPRNQRSSEMLNDSSCLSVRMEQFSSHWTNFHEILVHEEFSKICREDSTSIKI